MGRKGAGNRFWATSSLARKCSRGSVVVVVCVFVGGMGGWVHARLEGGEAPV